MQTNELAEHLFASLLGTFDMLTIHVGEQFGLYRLLHERGPLDVAEVAAASGMHPRYAREWLEQQTVAGLVATEDASLPAGSRRYGLPDAHAAVLADPDSLSYMAPFARLVAAVAGQLPALLDAYRSGGGVGWSAYGELMRTAQADANRPLFLQVLGQEWLPALPDVHQALTGGGSVADIGCGEGWSSIGVALAYPAARVHGYDVDEASIAAARRHAEEQGVTDRVSFHLVDGGSVQPEDRGYDLVTAFECVHDMPDPVGVLTGARRMVREGGTVLVVDERVPEEFTGPGDPVEQLMYGFSMLVCLPDGMSTSGSVGTGTVMRPATLRGYTVEAGFADLEVLPIEHEVFRLYRLVG